jgi:hypothetical protein
MNMKKIASKLLAAAVIGAALINLEVHAQPLTLSGTSYFQNFDSLNSGLPGEWLLYTGATPSSLGALTSFTNSNPANAVNDWNSSSFSFKNCASTNDTVHGTNYIGTEPIAAQAITANRVLAVRTTAANDPGNAFVLKVVNTIGFGNFVLDVDMLNLSPQGRTNNWTLDYGISPDGSSPPTSFIVVSNFYTDLGTNSSPLGAFGSTHRTVNFGDLLDDEPGPIWIRIVNLTASGGANNRPTVGIDNYNLTFTTVPDTTRPPAVVNQPQSVTNLEFSTVTFSVGASGTSPFTYQWYEGTAPLSDGPTVNGSTISGSTSPLLTITSVRVGDAGNYSVTVTNAADGTNSHAATLTVTPRPFAITNIAYLRTLVSSTFLATNSIPLWQVTGIVTTFTNLTSGNTASYYLQDGTAGINIFQTLGATFRPAQGDVVTFIGFLSSFNSTLELEADPGNVPVTGGTILSNNIAALPAPRLIPFTITNSTALVETNIEASIVMLTNVFFAGTNGGAIIGLSNLTVLVTNASGQSFTVTASSQDTDLFNGTNAWPVFASTIIGPLTQNLPNTTNPRNAGYQLTVTRFSDMVTNPLTVAQSLSNGTNTLSWSSAPFTYPYSVLAATNVQGPYTALTNNLHFSDTNGSYIDPNANAAQEFYRVSTP